MAEGPVPASAPAPSAAARLYPNTPQMVDDLPRQQPAAEAPTQRPAAPSARTLYPNTPQMRDEGEAPPAGTEPVRPRSALYPNTPNMTDDGPPAPEGGEAPAADDPRVAAYFLDLPQGYTPDPQQLGRFKGLAVKHGLAPAVASELVGFHAEVLRAEEQALAQEVAGWRAAAEKLPEMQGDGRQAVAHAAALADPETKAWLDSTGLGNHPMFVRWAARVGRELYRLKGGRPEPTPSQRLQPNLPHLNP